MLQSEGSELIAKARGVAMIATHSRTRNGDHGNLNQHCDSPCPPDHRPQHHRWGSEPSTNTTNRRDTIPWKGRGGGGGLLDAGADILYALVLQ